MFFISSASVAKDKKVKNKRAAGTIEYGIIEPDEMPSRPRPDHHNKPLEAPVLLFLGGGDGGCGFDISHYQGKINWDELAMDKNAGFMYIKASEGSNLKDNMYDGYLAEAKRVGFKVGAYHFFRATATAEEQARNFLSAVSPATQDLLPIIDVEVIGKKVSTYQFHERLKSLLDIVEKAFGRKPIIYTGQNFYNKHLSGGRYAAYKFMIACYTEERPVLVDNNDFILWQFTGHGKARGVSGYIDISRFVNGHSMKDIMYK